MNVLYPLIIGVLVATVIIEFTVLIIIWRDHD